MGKLFVLQQSQKKEVSKKLLEEKPCVIYDTNICFLYCLSLLDIGQFIKIQSTQRKHFYVTNEYTYQVL